MKAVILINGELKVEDIQSPLLAEGEALIKVLKAGLCNTDMELIKGYMDFEGVLGHEFVGRIVEASEKDWVGKRVVGEINISCHECEMCQTGNSKHCLSRQVLGIQKKDGVFTEYVTLPLSNLHVLPSEISDIEAVFVEPLAAALEILEQIRIRKEHEVLVLGDGKLGLLIAQVMQTQTPHVFCVGHHPRKLTLLQKKGIQTSLEGQKWGQMFDVIVEATGNPKGLSEALCWIKPRGRIVVKSTFHGESKLDLSRMVVDEIQLIGSRCGPFGKALEFLKKRLIDVIELVDADFPLEEAQKAFELAKKPETMKVLLTP
ncbi:MAG: alcohol dehydrogenase catalytic domain-containing protein [Candidatus Aminicenantes bacterium]|nr:alcohol dehydrogenase catalytic domain-containing protein [Candidatus Aminicenantes bacterium]MDH5383357.1 alcohol dehydrogenase catalytic domain-containing protein [Candidatus Aminicenantes bacterium]MDH5742007.1 alcohol dehydrogenase catalytic domain-containing protein [Candidatus Aminicenantes bacterium]